MIKCPTCGKNIAEKKELCIRCETELGILFKLKEAAECSFIKGCECIQKLDFINAHKLFSKSNRIMSSAKTKKAMFASLVADENYSKGVKCYFGDGKP